VKWLSSIIGFTFDGENKTDCYHTALYITKNHIKTTYEKLTEKQKDWARDFMHWQGFVCNDCPTKEEKK